jgi:hypothetical protein
LYRQQFDTASREAAVAATDGDGAESEAVAPMLDTGERWGDPLSVPEPIADE